EVDVAGVVQVEAERPLDVLPEPDVGRVRLRVVLEPHPSVPRRDDHPGRAVAARYECGQLATPWAALEHLAAQAQQRPRQDLVHLGFCDAALDHPGPSMT